MRESFAVRCFILFVASAHIAPRLIFWVMSLIAQGAVWGETTAGRFPTLRERVRVRESFAVRCFILFVASAHIALPVNLLRYARHGAGSAQGGQSPPPLYPWLRPATSTLRGAFDLSLQAFGSGRGSVRAKHGLSPHPCGLPRPSGNVSAMLRPPAPAVSSGPMSGGDSHTGSGPCRPDKASAATRQNNGATGLPGR